MTGLRLTLPTSFTDTTLPILRDDPMLAKGSLGLYEIGHPGTGIAGIPANAATIPNIALKEAKALIPGATDAELGAIVKTITQDAANFKLERTGKGGLHAYIRKSAAPAGTNFFGLYGRAKVAQYIRDNIAHDFYFSYWGIETRSPITGVGAFAGLGFGANGSSSSVVFSHDSNNYPTSSTYRTGFAREVNGASYLNAQYSDANTAYPGMIPAKVRLSIGIKNTAETITRDGASVEAGSFFKLFSVGSSSELFSSNQLGSNIHYRFYAEDLTVSGRTYAQADAVDKSEYAKHVLTAGGRYYADTFTDPATLA